ncbi:MAG: hypothetical protein NTY70_05085, partial [Burkholderiales bacterium]|nr:hypothetical protein [Burkholderiales bacterium]
MIAIAMFLTAVFSVVFLFTHNPPGAQPASQKKKKKVALNTPDSSQLGAAKLVTPNSFPIKMP